MKYIFLTVILLLVIGVGGYFLLQTYPNEEISMHLPFTTEDHDGEYLTYTPSSYSSSAIKRGIVVFHPGDWTKDEALKNMRYWKTTADDYGFMIISHYNHSQWQELLDVVPWVRKNTDAEKLYLTGVSAGGYQSCGIGLESQDSIDGIIPLAAFCSDFDLDGQTQKVPILTVIGENDTWALGDDGTLPYSNTLIDSEFIIVPDLGHTFPAPATDQIAEWILAH